MAPPKGDALAWLRPYNRFRENWQEHYGHTSFFGEEKPKFIEDWHMVRDGIDPGAAASIKRRLESGISKKDYDKLMRNEKVRGNMARLRAERKAAIKFA
jgi:hypothetical protein